MKKIYNQADLTDMPLDSSAKVDKSSVTKASESKKAKINVISSKKTDSKTKKVSAPTKKTGESQDKKTKLRTKLKSDSVDIVDLEKLNEENIKSRSFRSRRNQMIIIILSILLAIAIAAIAIYASVALLGSNCMLYVHGDGSAVYLINGDELNKFRAPNSIQGNRVFEFNAKLKIESSGEFDVKFEIKVYQGSLLLDNTEVYDVNVELFTKGADGAYYSRAPISGKQTIWLCNGVDLRLEYEKSLNEDNFKMEIHTTLTKV